jgi:hypothetical protein
VFTDREAECENWEDPSRSFICPACHTRLIPNHRMKTPLELWMERFRTHRRHIPKLIVGVLTLLLLMRIDSTMGTIAVIISIAAIVLFTLWQPLPPEMTQRADDRTFNA